MSSIECTSSNECVAVWQGASCTSSNECVTVCIVY
jgi:hypothetical protein